MCPYTTCAYPIRADASTFHCVSHCVLDFQSSSINNWGTSSTVFEFTGTVTVNMSLLLTLKKIFTLGLFSNILGSSESSEVNQNVRGLLRDDMKSFAYFVMHSYYYLNITPLIEMSVYRSEDCGMSCLKHVSCLSYNVAAFRDLREQKTLCELLPSDKYNESNRFSPSQHYHHFSIMVS